MHNMRARREFMHGKQLVRLGQAFVASPNDRAYLLEQGTADDDVVTKTDVSGNQRAKTSLQKTTARPAPVTAPQPTLADVPRARVQEPMSMHDWQQPKSDDAA